MDDTKNVETMQHASGGSERTLPRRTMFLVVATYEGQQVLYERKLEVHALVDNGFGEPKVSMLLWVTV